MPANISKRKRDALLAKIEQVRTFLQKLENDENVHRLVGFLDEMALEVGVRKYGLVFEQHREAIDEMLETHLPILTEEESLFVDNGGKLNFLIEGDNLASLLLLKKTHKGKIDVIYIDPPYNTGNKDFVYDDSFVDINDNFRHSKWLSFMEKRLRLARDLLNEKGVIFISIDDNEQAGLKLLCDEIFGANNFESIIWKKKGGAGNTERILGCLTEYVLCFFKEKRAGVFRYRDIERNYKFLDEKGNYNLEGIEKTNSGVYERPSMLFPITDPKTGEKFRLKSGMRWTIGEKGIEQALKDEKLFFDYEKRKVYYIKRTEDYQKSSNVFYNLLLEYDSLSVAKNELEEILGNRELFDTPKPLSLISHLINLTVRKNATILDFFAGSGTTGHAVLKLNAEDGGSRTFILCTNNENDICRDITYQRLKTAITGIRADGSEYSQGFPGSLKYFRVDFVPVAEKEYYEYADKLLLHIRELVELENGVNFAGNPSAVILLSDKEVQDFCCHAAEKLDVHSAYIGHDVLLTAEQKMMFSSRGISVKIIPQYYYLEMNG